MFNRRLLMRKKQNAIIGNIEQWMLDASTNYGIPIENLQSAYSIDEDIKKTFDGTGRTIQGDGSSYFYMNVVEEYSPNFEVELQSFCGNQLIDNTYVTMYNKSSDIILNIGKGWQDGNGGCIYRLVYGSYNYLRYAIANGNFHSLLLTTNGSMKIDGQELSYQSQNASSASSGICKDITLFSLRNGGSITTAQMGFIRISDKHFFIPILLNNVATMIDLITMDYPIKVGNFEIA